MKLKTQPMVDLKNKVVVLKAERDGLLSYLRKIADAAHAGQNNLTRDESVTKIIASLSDLDRLRNKVAELEAWKESAAEETLKWMSLFDVFNPPCVPGGSRREAVRLYIQDLQDKVAKQNSLLGELLQCNHGHPRIPVYRKRTWVTPVCYLCAPCDESDEKREKTYKKPEDEVSDVFAFPPKGS